MPNDPISNLKNQQVEKMRKLLFGLLIIAASSFTNCFAASFYCGKHIVDIGDTAYDVSMKCKESMWIDNSEIEVVREIAPGKWKLVHVDKEVRVLNRGPNKFMKKLVFINNILNDIRDLNYGLLEKDIGSFRNIENKLYINMSKPEVLIYWGEPDNKSSIMVEKIYKSTDNDFIRYNVSIETWIYNFGSDQFLKKLVFENDGLVEILSGTYGYDNQN